MKLHDGHLFTVGKRVNGGQWMLYGSTTTHDEAVQMVDRGMSFHLERCPKDQVEWNIYQTH